MVSKDFQTTPTKGLHGKRLLVCFLVFAALFMLQSVVVTELNASKTISEGDLAPAFALQDLGGAMWNLAGNIGNNVIMLDFWSIYCVACVQALPKLIELYEKYKDQGLVVYGINLDSFGLRRVKRFISGLGYDITYPVMVDRKREVAGAYNVNILPTTILIDKNGKVELFHIGYKPGDEMDLDYRIRKLLK